MPEDDLSGWTARPRPDGRSLEGRWCRLERLDPARHGDALHAASLAAGAEDRFRYLFEPPPANRGIFDAWLAAAAGGDDPLFYAVIDAASGRAGGRQALMRIVPEHGVIEIGSILWGPGIARTRIATEALFLFAQHVFATLGYRRLEWKCDALNTPSRQAALRFGFSFEGVFRRHMVVKGRNRDTAWFAIAGEDWPRLAAAYAAWLDPSNFDSDGRQRRSLRDCAGPA